MLDLNAMVMFAQVVHEGGFAPAARRLGLSTSTVSRRIAALEDDLRARLLDRTSRTLSLTDVGAVFLERCQRVAAEADAASDTVSALQAEPQGRLRISASPLFTRSMLDPLLPGFLARHPRIDLELHVTVRMVDVIGEGFDVVIRAGQPPIGGLIGRRIGETPSYIVAAPDHIAAHGMPADPAELSARRCLLYSPDRGPRSWRLTRGDRTVLTRVEGHRVDDLHVVRNLARAGAGITRLPGLLCADDLRSGHLVRVLPAWSSGAVPVHALYPSRRYISPAVRAFLDLLVSEIDLSACRVDGD